MARFIGIAFAIATIMGAAPRCVNAERVTFTETITAEQAQKGQTLKDLITTLSTKGHDDRLTAGVGPRIDLDDKAPVKVLSLRPNPPKWLKRFCDLVFTQTDPTLPPHPHCFVLIDKTKNGREVRFVRYRFDLTGRLVAADEMVGEDDEDGKPIKGTAKILKPDISDKKVQAEAAKLLDFWRLGAYSKHLPTAADRPAVGRK
ncbi:MAG: hypothetical protein HY079_11625 [Elusimicrobia bacterium]|nr:hypothetical protein [Elusimicrobiota bacterium]